MFNLRPGEKIIFRKRRHWLFLVLPIFYLFLATLALFIILFYFKFSWVSSLSFFLWLILAGLYGLKTFLCFRNTENVLTNQRILDLDQKGIFYKTSSEIPLEKITDVSFQIKGFFPSLFDYGNVYLKGAGEGIVLEDLGEPEKIKEEILETIQGQEKKVKGLKEGRRERKEKDFWD